MLLPAHLGRSALLLLLALLATAPRPARAASFDGSTSNDWFTADNWSTGLVPDLLEFVSIGGGFAVTALGSDAGGSSVEAEALEKRA